eukprot:SAG25_NODE_6188_length_580_cov_2.095634_1_plen_85_part_01
MLVSAAVARLWAAADSATTHTQKPRWRAAHTQQQQWRRQPLGHAVAHPAAQAAAWTASPCATTFPDAKALAVELRVGCTKPGLAG